MRKQYQKGYSVTTRGRVTGDGLNPEDLRKNPAHFAEIVVDRFSRVGVLMLHT